MIRRFYSNSKILRNSTSEVMWVVSFCSGYVHTCNIILVYTTSPYECQNV